MKRFEASVQALAEKEEFLQWSSQRCAQQGGSRPAALGAVTRVRDVREACLDKGEPSRPEPRPCHGHV